MLQQRLQELREFNDALSTPEKTALVRGQISEVKRLLALSVDSTRAANLPLDGEIEPSGN